MLTLRTQPFGDDRRDSLAKLAETILQAPKLPPLISSGAIDLSSLLTTARLPLGKDADQKNKSLNEPETPPQQPSPPKPKSAPAITPPSPPSSRRKSKKTIVIAPAETTSKQLPDAGFRQAPKGKPVKVGPRGGRYYYTDSGKKVYVDDTATSEVANTSGDKGGVPDSDATKPKSRSVRYDPPSDIAKDVERSNSENARESTQVADEESLTNAINRWVREKEENQKIPTYEEALRSPQWKEWLTPGHIDTSEENRILDCAVKGS